MRSIILFLFSFGLAACATMQSVQESQHTSQSILAEEVLDSHLNEQVVKVPVAEKQLSGGKQVNLETTIFKPDGACPGPRSGIRRGNDNPTTLKSPLPPFAKRGKIIMDDH